MAWANQNGTYNGYDMDSAQGTEDHKLVVRNHGASAAGTHRVEILDTVGGSALRIIGRTDIQKLGTTHPVNNCGVIEGEVDNVGSQDEHGVLGINASVNGTSDPDVKIGWGGVDAGNYVEIYGKEVGVGGGRPGSGYHVGILGPAKTSGDHTISGTLIADNAVLTPEIESLNADENLEIGTGQTENVVISQTNHQTIVVGALLVSNAASSATTGLIVGSGGANIQGDIIMHGGALSTGGGSVTAQNVTAAGTVAATGQVSGGSLDINGNGDVLGDLTVHGDTATTGVVSGGSLDINGNGDVSGNLTVEGDLKIDGHVVGLASTAAVSVEQSSTTISSLAVKQNATTGTAPAVEAIANAANHTGVALTATGTTAIKAIGACSFDGTAKITGDLTMSANVVMGGHTINMGGTGAGLVEMKYASNRLEIYVGGTLHFYVDNTGGHSV